MRKLIVTAIVAFVTAQANAAPASPDSVETLLTVIKTEAMLDSMYASMEQIMRQSMQQAAGGKPMTPEQQRILDAVPGKFVAVMKSELTWDKLKPQYVQLYLETFDQEEIDGLLAFYRRDGPGVHKQDAHRHAEIYGHWPVANADASSQNEGSDRTSGIRCKAHQIVVECG